jgi:hypothetical protein
MASRPQPRGRQDERHLSIRTLVIASLASLFAALVTSQFWRAGTPITAAITPVLVALISELINRPTEKIVQRLTTEGAPVRPARPRYGRAPDPADRRAREPEDALASGQVSVYGRPTRTSRRKIAFGVVLATGVLGFAAAAVALTVPELITGHSIVKDNRKSTIFGGHHKKKASRQETTPTTTTPTTTEQPTNTQTTPQNTTTEKKQQTTPQQQTTTSPAPPVTPSP